MAVSIIPKKWGPLKFLLCWQVLQLGVLNSITDSQLSVRFFLMCCRFLMIFHVTEYENMMFGDHIYMLGSFIRIVFLEIWAILSLIVNTNKHHWHTMCFTHFDNHEYGHNKLGDFRFDHCLSCSTSHRCDSHCNYDW